MQVAIYPYITIAYMRRSRAILNTMANMAGNLLALECGGQVCSVALGCQGEGRMLANHGPGSHGQHLLRLVHTLLDYAGIRPAQLTAVAFGRGPGSFTGIRIAAAAAMGIATGVQLPVIPISTLAATAQAHITSHGKVAVACNARMGEIYHGLYQERDGIAVALTEEAVSKITGMPTLDTTQWFGAGDAWSLKDMDSSGLYDYDSNRTATAMDLIPLAENAPRLDPEKALPVYLRNKVANVK